MLRIHVTGVGDAFTERYHNASLCIEDVDSGLLLQVDCPPAFPRVLADYRQRSGQDLRVERIDHLLLTHLHGDHCGGTEAYLYLRRFVVGRKPTLHGAKEVLDGLWSGRLRGGMERLLLSVPVWTEESLRDHSSRDAPASDDRRLLADPGGQVVELGLLDYTARQELLPGITHVGRLRIERRFTRHHIPTTALRISLERPGAPPRPLVSYSADTAFDPDLIHWLSAADLIIHETNFGVHTPLASLLLLPAELRQRMRLIHYPDLLDPDTAPIRCLREGEVIELG
jgi:ribonuclease BN (tRNA processing enzyme)